MRETTDTANQYTNRDIPDGRYSFKVVSVTKKVGKKNVPFYIWKLDYGIASGEQVLLPSMMGNLLRVLGCTEISPNKFDWDTDAVEGKTFEATVSHEPDKKDPSKIRQQMNEFKEGIPF